ncbi:hypothetical protein NXC24_PB00357 (plasmid) [Rhizobium sp. NXC24]|nr:hypothetical protein NXC24_PB00357 [Rhizobium sp. NXC24]
MVLDLSSVRGYRAARDWASTLVGEVAEWRTGKLRWSNIDSRLLFSGQREVRKDRIRAHSGKNARCAFHPDLVGCLAEQRSVGRPLVSALLEMIDGGEKNEGIFIMGACNFSERLDPALKWSGCLAKHNCAAFI